MQQASVALLGTGILGSAVTRRLLAAGHEVRVWNRTRERCAPLAEAGAVVAERPVDAVRGAKVVLTLLSDGPVTAAVMEDGALGAMDAGSLWIQSATVGVPAIADLSRLAAEAKVAFVDAPVLGTREPAERGELTILAAGDRSLEARCAPIFEAIARRVLWAGEVGAASRLKLVVNSWVIGLAALLGETLALAGALDIEGERFLEAIEGSALDCAYARIKGEAMLAHDYPASFPLELARKDARLIDEAARHATLPLEIARAAERYLAAAERDGHARDDFSAIFEAIRAARA